MRFSVIMPVCLDNYPGCATNRESKFVRAVNSFIQQVFTDAELIIISDGSKRVEEIYQSTFAGYLNIKFIYLDKQTLFSGKVRQTGLKMAQGEIICYLDHDDFIGADHLKIINENFDFKYDWVFYNDYLIKGKEAEKLVFMERKVSPQLFYIGTSMIAHKRSINVVWPDNYAHDWRMIEVCLLPHRGLKIPNPQYYVCHFHTKDF